MIHELEMRSIKKFYDKLDNKEVELTKEINRLRLRKSAIEEEFIDLCGCSCFLHGLVCTHNK